MYKKKLTIALFLFFAIVNIQAQVTFKPGLRGGFTFSTVSEMQGDYKTDFYAGGFGEINITKRYALQPEVTYTRQGSNNLPRNYFDDIAGVEKVEFRDLQIDYLSLAVINKLTFGSGIQMQFGSVLDLLLHDNLIKRKENNDLAFIIGIAYKVSPNLTIEGRLKKGLLDIMDNDNNRSHNVDDFLFAEYNTNINFQLGLSYSFGEKK
jgi:hypothetical protein